jgi:hypothetical protein
MYLVLVQNTGGTDNENAFNSCYKGNKVYSLDANRIIIIIIIDMAIQRKGEGIRTSDLYFMKRYSQLIECP